MEWVVLAGCIVFAATVLTAGLALDRRTRRKADAAWQQAAERLGGRFERAELDVPLRRVSDSRRLRATIKGQRVVVEQRNEGKVVTTRITAPAPAAGLARAPLQPAVSEEPAATEARLAGVRDRLGALACEAWTFDGRQMSLQLAGIVLDEKRRSTSSRRGGNGPTRRIDSGHDRVHRVERRGTGALWNHRFEG